MSRRSPRSAWSRARRSRLRSAHRPRDKVVAEAAHRPLLGLRADPSPHRYPAAHPFIEVGLGLAPVGLEEAVGAVPGDGHRLHAGSDRGGLLGHRGPADEEAGDLGQVVAAQPERMKPAGVRVVVREHHHPAGHPLHLPQPGQRVSPVVNGGEGHRGVERLILERKALGVGGHARRRPRRALRPHDRRRLHRGDLAVGGLVGAAPAPTFRTVRASPSADQTCAAIRGSVRRVAA